MKKLLFLLFICSAFLGCQQKHKKKLISIKEYKVSHDKECYTNVSPNENKSASDDLLFWYIITCNSNNSAYYYYYSSPTAMTNFSNVNWTLSQTFPVETADEANGVTVAQTNISEPVTDMSQDMQTEMSDNPEYFGGMTESEMGDYEGGESSQSSSESSGESSSSDSGSSDSGGDSGGDGGGGGGD
jgi:hypothetical protein